MPPDSPLLSTPLTRELGIRLPIIGGPMFPCSNAELVGAVSAAGGIGVIQPISLTWVHGHDFREGIRLILRLSGGAPVGMNALIEGGGRRYRRRMDEWLEIALEEGIRFFVTSLGNPRPIVDRVAPHGGRVYHDVTELKWGVKGRDGGVHGLIAVNARAGGHAGSRDPRPLLDELAPLGLPVVCAGGVSTGADFRAALDAGYAGVQVGTRFIATPECRVGDGWKEAIVQAGESDIVHTERVTGIPLAVIATPRIRREGVRASALARRLLRGRLTKKWVRSAYRIRAGLLFRHSALSHSAAGEDYWQAGRSVAGIDAIESVATIMKRFEDAVTG